MQMNKLLPLSCTIAFFLVGCTSHPHVSLDPSWSQKPQTLNVFFAAPVITNLDDFADDNPEGKDNSGEWFRSKFDSTMKAQSGLNVTVTLQNDSLFRSDRDTLDNKTISYPRTTIPLTGDVVLCISPIRVSRHTETSTSMGGMNTMGGGMNGGFGVSQTTTTSLVFEGEYAYYDARTNKRLAFGTLNVSRNFGFVMTKSDWIKNIAVATKQIFDKTPIHK